MLLRALLCVALACLCAAARAERFVIQRGDALFLVARDGSEIRKFVTIGSAPGTLWAVSPDGRRVAWLTQPIGEGSLDARPATLFLNDITGRKFKKLAVTDALRDRLGRPVSALSPATDAGHASPLALWAPVSLSWSADSKTLYLGFAQPDATLATVAVDGARGAALVDGDGRWRQIAPVAQADARGALVAAVGLAGAKENASLALLNLGDGTLTRVPSADNAEYGVAAWPALSPDGQKIAFTGQTGIFLAEGPQRAVRRLVLSEAVRPRWSETGASVFFLAPRPSTAKNASYDLYELPLMGDAPKLILQNVDWFDAVPD